MERNLQSARDKAMEFQAQMKTLVKTSQSKEKKLLETINTVEIHVALLVKEVEHLEAQADGGVLLLQAQQSLASVTGH